MSEQSREPYSIRCTQCEVLRVGEFPAWPCIGGGEHDWRSVLEDQVLRPAPGGGARVEPESPRRLRECLSALSRHDRANVLRVELSLGRATDGTDAPAFGMMVTHSLGPEHEEKLAPSLMETFAAAIEGTLVEAEKRER